MGLLGTVIGVINAFQGIGASSSAGIGAVSVGISEALVETALGLVAIPSSVVLQLPEWPYRVSSTWNGRSSSNCRYFIKKTA